MKRLHEIPNPPAPGYPADVIFLFQNIDETHDDALERASAMHGGNWQVIAEISDLSLQYLAIVPMRIAD